MPHPRVHSPDAKGKSLLQVKRSVAGGPLRRAAFLTRSVRSPATYPQGKYRRPLERPQAGLGLSWAQYNHFLEVTGAVVYGEFGKPVTRDVGTYCGEDRRIKVAA